MRSYALLSTLAAFALAEVNPSVMMMKVSAPSRVENVRIQTVIVGGFAPAATAGGSPIARFQFSPETINAQPGDSVRFVFMGNNHSVVQTSFEKPCKPASNGFSTGFKPNALNQLVGAPTTDLPIKDTTPLYLSSLDVSMCGKGMVFTVNPPSVGAKTFVNFKSNAVKEGAPNLKVAQIVAAQPVRQIASTISIKAQGNGAAQATPGAPASSATPATPGGPASGASPASGGAPAIVEGQGTTGAGQACGCQCLCGAGSIPANAGQGAFGGVLGAMPVGSLMGGMSPAPAGGPQTGTQMGRSPAAAPPQANGTRPNPAAALGNSTPAAIQIRPGPPPASGGSSPAGLSAVPNAKVRRL